MGQSKDKSTVKSAVKSTVKSTVKMHKTLPTSFSQQMAYLENGLPPSDESGFLGASLDPADCKLVLIPVPWEATTSYGGGTSRGPHAILRASHQLDLADPAFGPAYRAGITFLSEHEEITAMNTAAKTAAQYVIENFSKKSPTDSELVNQLELVNRCSHNVNTIVYEQAKTWLGKGKFLGVVGGDHSCPQGLIQALAEQHRDGFGILHFDAHHDLREAYEGFKYSHASIFYNVMTSYPEVSRLVQVAIRDYSREERQFMESLGDRGDCYYGRDIFKMKAEGRTFQHIAREMTEALPQKVYISFDIDALDPSYCPSTGTPVPGGISFDEALYILEEVVASGRQVIGFDLCEVAPNGDDEWDANVGARMLYKLCGALLRSQRCC